MNRAGVSAARAESAKGRVESAAHIASMYFIIHTMKVDILICK